MSQRAGAVRALRAFVAQPGLCAGWNGQRAEGGAISRRLLPSSRRRARSRRWSTCCRIPRASTSPATCRTAAALRKTPCTYL
eukprot:458061-Pyramimonas_sp.AAC.1